MNARSPTRMSGELPGYVKTAWAISDAFDGTLMDASFTRIAGRPARTCWIWGKSE